MLVRIGVSRSSVSGISKVASASRSISASPGLMSAITLPPRAFTSSMLDTILGCTASCGAMNTTGMFWSIRAMGPCFISAAGYPSAWMYEISLSLSAPSSATGKLSPRPRYRKFVASVLLGDLADQIIALEDLLELLGELPHRLRELPSALGRQVPAASEEQRQERQHRNLAGERLGRRYADLGPGVDVDAAVRGAGDRRSHRVDDP